MTRFTTRKKVICSVLITVFFVFLIFNILWFLHFASYKKFLDDKFVMLSGSLTSFFDQTEPTHFGIKKPPYLTYGGNLYAVSADQANSIIIWPTLMCKEIQEIGLIIEDDGGMGYMVYVDENMEYDTNKNMGASIEWAMSAKSLLQERQSEINELFEQAKTRFNLPPHKSPE
ncbi:MAG: hypothetical protein LBK75_07670 [Oscillospiraceae bacterium]|nr:hypothetical protein [Oscillospiraceae bacterium]